MDTISANANTSVLQQEERQLVYYCVAIKAHAESGDCAS